MLDAHAHIIQYGAVKLNVNLSGCTSKEGAARFHSTYSTGCISNISGVLRF